MFVETLNQTSYSGTAAPDSSHSNPAEHRLPLDSATRVIIIQSLYMHDVLLLDYHKEKSVKSLVKEVVQFMAVNVVEGGDKEINDLSKTVEGGLLYTFPNPDEEATGGSPVEKELYGRDGFLSSLFRDKEFDDVYIDRLCAIVSEIIYLKLKIDDVVAGKIAQSWTIDKLGSVMRAIVRLGVFEVLYVLDDAARYKKLVREFIKLADLFCHSRDTGFIHALLDAVYKECRGDISAGGGGAVSSGDGSADIPPL